MTKNGVKNDPKNDHFLGPKIVKKWVIMDRFTRDIRYPKMTLFGHKNDTKNDQKSMILDPPSEGGTPKLISVSRTRI